MQADVGDMWDARAEFIDRLDQTVDPNEPWSYRNGDPTRADYGDLLVWKDTPQWGQLPSYTQSLDVDAPPMLGFNMFGADGPFGEELGGHGAWMIRWTSPVDGWIQITGYVYMPRDSAPNRVTNWQLLHNAALVTQGFTGHTETRQLFGLRHRVLFEEGSAGLRGTFVQVEEGDELDLITPGSNVLGDPTVAPVSAKFVITQIDPADVPQQNTWDAHADFAVGLDQADEPNDPWSYRNGNGSAGNGEYGEVLDWDEFSEAYSPSGTDAPSISSSVLFFNGEDPLNEQLVGRGSWLLRWTSPVDGWIKVGGYVYQTVDADFEPGRLTNWRLLKNDAVFTQGLTARDTLGAVNGYEHRVDFEGGAGGVNGTYLEVQQGDRVDLITPGSGLFGDPEPTTVGVALRISKIDAADVPARDTWDAKLGFVDGLDQSTNPNLPWTYRTGDDAELLVWKPNGQFDQGPLYGPAGIDDQPPVVAGQVIFGGNDPANEQIGGHGNFCIRWTSPIDGWIQVTGYIYQPPQDNNRLTNWRILKGPTLLTQGFTATNETRPINGFESRVSFDSGSAGAAGAFVEVSVGDIVDLVTPGSNKFEDFTPSPLAIKYTITETPAPPTNLTVTALDNSVQLSWHAAADTSGVTVLGYNVIQTSPGGHIQVNENLLAEPELSISGLEAGVEVCYLVEAVGSNARTSQQTNAVCTTPTLDTREVWDARTDFVDGLDQATNPNLPWTYRNGQSGENLGALLVWKADGQFEEPNVYAPSLDSEDPPIVAGRALIAGDDPSDEQLGGHGPYMIRWTSPFDGVVQLSGYIYQPLQDNFRVTSWQFAKNGGVFTRGFTAIDEVAPLNGYENRVSFEAGSGGRARTFREVKIGDTIDLLTLGHPTFGDPEPGWVNTHLKFRRADPSEVPQQTIWDARRDFVTGLDQSVEQNGPWTYRSGEAGSYGELLVWRPESQWGVASTYTRSLDVQLPPMVAPEANGVFSGEDPDNEQIGGHGSWLIRWTSPVDGEIEISGYLYQTSVAAPNRITVWRLLKNDEIFTEGITRNDLGPINGFHDRTFFTEGTGGEDALIQDVQVGDTIDFITPGNGQFGDALPTTIASKYTIALVGACVPSEANESSCDDGLDNDCDDAVDGADSDCDTGHDVGPFVRGDCDSTGSVGGSPTEAIILLNFAFKGGKEPGCLAACDAEANGSIGITDALRILRHSFLGDGQPDAPFPDCTRSAAPSDVELGCRQPVVCP